MSAIADGNVFASTHCTAADASAILAAVGVHYSIFTADRDIGAAFAITSADACTLTSTGAVRLPAAVGRDIAAGDFDVSSAAVKTATNASRTAVSCFVVVASAGRCDSTASNLNVTAAVVFCSSNTCTLCAASRRQRAFFASIILNGQCTLRVAVVLLDACVVSAALQLVLAVQLQPDVAVAFYLEGGVFVRLDADVLEGHVRGLPPPPDLIVTVFFSDLPVMTVSVSRTVSLSP